MSTITMNPTLWMPASLIPAGRTVVLRRVRSGQGLATRLATLGLLPGMSVEVCQNQRRGPMVLRANGSRIMLGRGIAERLMVEEL